jgi:hypothetical protein
MNFRKCAIGASLTGIGLLLAAVMVCATEAETPQAETPTTTPKPTDVQVQAVPYITSPVPSKSESPNGSGSFPLPPARQPNDGLKYYAPTGPGPERAYTPTRTTPTVTPRIGRFQAISHEGQLLLLDTTSGECWVRSGTGDWNRIALPVDPNATPVDPRH